MSEMIFELKPCPVREDGGPCQWAMTGLWHGEQPYSIGHSVRCVDCGQERETGAPRP